MKTVMEWHVLDRVLDVMLEAPVPNWLVSSDTCSAYSPAMLEQDEWNNGVIKEKFRDEFQEQMSSVLDITKYTTAPDNITQFYTNKTDVASIQVMIDENEISINKIYVRPAFQKMKVFSCFIFVLLELKSKQQKKLVVKGCSQNTQDVIKGHPWLSEIFKWKGDSDGWDAVCDVKDVQLDNPYFTMAGSKISLKSDFLNVTAKDLNNQEWQDERIEKPAEAAHGTY
jgi:hypothetical protein